MSTSASNQVASVLPSSNNRSFASVSAASIRLPRSISPPPLIRHSTIPHTERESLLRLHAPPSPRPVRRGQVRTPRHGSHAATVARCRSPRTPTSGVPPTPAPSPTRSSDRPTPHPARTRRTAPDTGRGPWPASQPDRHARATDPDRHANHAAGVFIPASSVTPPAIAAAVTATNRAITMFAAPANDATSDATSTTTAGAGSSVAVEDIPQSYTCSMMSSTHFPPKMSQIPDKMLHSVLCRSDWWSTPLGGWSRCPFATCATAHAT